MKVCHVCGFHCEDDTELCTFCGADLNPSHEEEEIEEVAEEIIISEPTLLGTFDDIVSAEIFKDILKDNNILYTSTSTENSLQVVFGGGFVSEEIYVDKQDLETAEKLYNEFLESEENILFEFDEEN